MDADKILNLEGVESIVEKHQGSLGSVMSILEDVQAKYGYLPEAALKVISDGTKIPLTKLYGVATFYSAFTLKPRGKHLISVCLGTACHVRGAPAIAEAFSRHLGIKPGETTDDQEFTLETVACLGACALGPVILADGCYHSQVKQSQVGDIIEKIKEGEKPAATARDDKVFPLEVSCPRCNHLLMDSKYLIDGYPSVRLTISFERKHGWSRLSSLYGSYSVESEYKRDKDVVANFFCPHCHSELLGGSDCAECGAPMIPLVVRGGGMVHFCSRRGCRSHMLDLSGVNF